MKHLTKSLLALGIACSAMSAFAANGFSGEISFLNGSKHLVTETIELNLSGEGLCKNFDIDWGDNTTSSIVSYYFNNDGPLKFKHKYKYAGLFTVKVYPHDAADTSPTQCGSRSGKIDILPTAVATSFTVLPAIVRPNQRITVSLKGQGQCKGGTKVLYNTQPDGGSKIFAADAPWPREATFGFKAEGDYFLRFFNEDNSTDGECAKFEGVWVKVKASVSPNLAVSGGTLLQEVKPILPLQPVLPVKVTTPTKPTAPAEQPCKTPGKQGVGKDCNTN